MPSSFLLRTNSVISALSTFRGAQLRGLLEKIWRQFPPISTVLRIDVVNPPVIERCPPIRRGLSVVFVVAFFNFCEFVADRPICVDTCRVGKLHCRDDNIREFFIEVAFVKLLKL